MTHIEFTCSNEKAAALLRASRLYDEGVKPAEWISVKDRLPDDLRFVLVYIRHKKTPYDQYRDIRIMLRLEKYGWLHLEERSEVTHWMPLPKPPKDASDASDS